MEVLWFWIVMFVMVQYTGICIRYVVTADHTPHLTSDHLPCLACLQRDVTLARVKIRANR
jgi:hypothetical protein